MVFLEIQPKYVLCVCIIEKSLTLCQWQWTITSHLWFMLNIAWGWSLGASVMFIVTHTTVSWMPGSCAPAGKVSHCCHILILFLRILLSLYLAGLYGVFFQNGWFIRFKAVPRLRRLVADPSHLAYVWFMVDQVALGQVLPWVLQLSPVINILPMHHTHISPIYHWCFIISAIDSIVQWKTFPFLLFLRYYYCVIIEQKLLTLTWALCRNCFASLTLWCWN